jgi:pimeloyl-ACP methyl ester carboxylesterase
MKKLTLIILAICIITACRKRLDDFVFNSDDNITSYQLDNFTDEVTLQVGSEYQIDPGNIHQFFIPLESNGEQLEIAAIYTGDTLDIATDTVIMYCHGNKDHMDFYWPRQKLLSNIGQKHQYGVLMIDYPGYGLSTGKSTEERLYESTNAALNWLKSKGLSSDQLIMYGYSLGTAPACQISAHNTYILQPSKLILEAPFASTEVMTQDAALINMPASFFTDVKLDNAEEIKTVNIPLLWIHGVADSYLNIETHGEVVFLNYQGPYKEAIRVPGGEHEDTPYIYGYKNYLKALRDYIQK